jgi:curved DNA-binding protein CbpA
MRSHYELLGVARTASVAEIRQAYARLARASHPDRFTDPAEKQRAAAEFRDITTAFNTLVNDRSRQEYDAAREQPVARTPEEAAAEAYARAQAQVEAGRLEEAITELRAAVHHAPEEARYRAALGRLLARHPASAREAVQQLERATALAPHDVAALADLAHLLAAQGLRIRARKVLESARRLAPGEPRLVRLAAALDSEGLDS